MKINIAAVTIIIGSHRAITAIPHGLRLFTKAHKSTKTVFAKASKSSKINKAGKEASKESSSNLFSNTDVSTIPVTYYTPDPSVCSDSCQRAILEFIPEGASRPLRLFIDTGSALTAVCPGRDIGKANLIYPSYYACATYSGGGGWFGKVYESMVVFGSEATTPSVKMPFSLMDEKSLKGYDRDSVFCIDGNVTHPGIDGIIGVGLGSTFLSRNPGSECVADDNPSVLRAPLAIANVVGKTMLSGKKQRRLLRVIE